jgi:hypothetical protein
MRIGNFRELLETRLSAKVAIAVVNDSRFQSKDGETGRGGDKETTRHRFLQVSSSPSLLVFP